VPERPLAGLLRQLPIFGALDAATLESIASASRVRTLAADESVIREGEPVRAFFAIVSGGVRIFRVSPDGREQVLQRVRPGQTFAEAAVLSMKRYPANAVATEDGTEVVEIGSETFLRLVSKVEELTVLSAGARLARYLLDLPSTASAEGAAIELPLAKRELAASLGITPETLSRLLRKWQDREVVRSEGSTIVVLDADVLMALADDIAS